jgi:hypothetical protein
VDAFLSNSAQIIHTKRLRDRDEALVWIIAHEAFHYLRRTRQIDGKNVEIEADRYAEGVLRAFQVLEEYPG